MERFLQAVHSCEARPRIYEELDIKVKGFATYGPAITRIIKVEGYWLADNDEYSTKITYCPFCGQKLEEG